MTAISFNPLFPVMSVIITAILVLGLLAWLEVRRNQKLLTARLCALLLSILSIVCLILNPVLSIKSKLNMVILTPGYSKKIVDSLLTVNSESQLYALQGARGINNTKEIENYRYLSGLNGNLFVLGEGVPPYMLEYIDTSSLHYFSGSTPKGFIGIGTDKIYTENQRGELAGIVNSGDVQTITLAGPGGTEDSIRVNAKNPQPFSISFTPKASGRYVYTLAASDSLGKIRYTEHVPIQVKKQKPLSILFLSEYPSAEVRFLKNFLEKNGHKLTLRYKISKNKYRTEFINTSPIKIKILNEALLQNFDLVFTDASSLTSVTLAEIRALKEVMKGGLGVLTQIHTTTLPKQANDLLALHLNKVKNDSAQLYLNKQHLKIPAAPVRVSSEKKLFTIQQEVSGRIVAGYYQRGLGKAGFQLLNHTFSRALAGEKETYAELWSPLINALARKEIKNYDVNLTTPFPYYPDEPIEFTIIATAQKPTVRMDSIEIPLIEDPLIKNIWLGKTWTGQVGWNALHIDQDSSSHNFFVSQPEEWKSLRVFNQQKNLRKLSSQKQFSTEQAVLQPVSRIIFFFLFLLSVAFLWLAPKL